MRDIGESTLHALMDAITTNGMRDANYIYFNLDDGWAASARTANGTLAPDAGTLPSGMSSLAAYAHARGLLLGLYTCRGTETCEGYPGSKGHEADDAETFAEWGIDYVKSDSCTASEVHADALAEYGAMASALSAAAMRLGRAPIFFSLCGWWTYFAAFGAARGGAGVGHAWRVSTDVPDWTRFLQNMDAAASVANLTGYGRGWADVDMIGGHWGADQERAHLSIIAVVGSPLLLSWDVRDPGAATLGLAPYLNPELLAIHGDVPDNLVTVGARYFYARIVGGAASAMASPPAIPLASGVDCTSTTALFTFVGEADANDTTATGQFESHSAPGYCVGIWDQWVGACVDPAAVQLVLCNSTAYGCPLEAQVWVVARNGTLANAHDPWHMPTVGSGAQPFPGPYLTLDATVPGALFVQPLLPATPAADGVLNQTQVWRTTVPEVAATAVTARSKATDTQRSLRVVVNTTVAAPDGRCLAASTPSSGHVWARWLNGGDVALLLLNLGTEAATVACDYECLVRLSTATDQPIPATWSARDVWGRNPAPAITTAAGYMSPVLPANGGSLLLRLTPRYGEKQVRA